MTCLSVWSTYGSLVHKRCLWGVLFRSQNIASCLPVVLQTPLSVGFASFLSTYSEPALLVASWCRVIKYRNSLTAVGSVRRPHPSCCELLPVVSSFSLPPHLSLIHFLFLFARNTLALQSLFHLWSLSSRPHHLICLQLIPLPSALHPSFPSSLSIDPAIVFCLPCAGWLALINIDNCLLSLDAKHAVVFLNESRSSPYTPPPQHGNPFVNDRR